MNVPPLLLNLLNELRKSDKIRGSSQRLQATNDCNRESIFLKPLVVYRFYCMALWAQTRNCFP